MNKNDVMKAMDVAMAVLRAVDKMTSSAADIWEEALYLVYEILEDEEDAEQPQAAEAKPRYEDFADGAFKDPIYLYRIPTQNGR